MLWLHHIGIIGLNGFPQLAFKIVASSSDIEHYWWKLWHRSPFFIEIRANNRSRRYNALNNTLKWVRLPLMNCFWILCSSYPAILLIYEVIIWKFFIARYQIVNFGFSFWLFDENKWHKPLLVVCRLQYLYK